MTFERHQYRNRCNRNFRQTAIATKSLETPQSTCLCRPSAASLTEGLVRSSWRSSTASKPTESRTRLSVIPCEPVGPIVASMGHRGRLLDERLDAKTDGQLKQASAPPPLCGSKVAGHFEAEHRAEAAVHLPPGNVIAGVTRQAG